MSQEHVNVVSYLEKVRNSTWHCHKQYFYLNAGAIAVRVNK